MPNPKKNTAYTFDIALVDSLNRPAFKANPTLAAGDFKISTDEAALTNLTNLPTVTPVSGRIVKIVLTAGEMNGDRVMIQCVDAAGNEWDEVMIYIDTTAVTVDDLVRSTTPANTLDVSATGEAGIDWANLGAPTTVVDLSGTTIKTTQVVGSVTGAVGSVTGAVGSVTGAVGSVTAGVSVATGGIPSTAFAAGAIDAAALATDAGQEIADALLGRNVAGGSSTGRLVKEALYLLRNKAAIAAGTLTVYGTDDITSAWTATVTTTAGNPISTIDPA
jgi:hypothetical protein